MPDLPREPFDDISECGLWQENGACPPCLARQEGKCLFNWNILNTKDEQFGYNCKEHGWQETLKCHKCMKE